MKAPAAVKTPKATVVEEATKAPEVEDDKGPASHLWGWGVSHLGLYKSMLPAETYGAMAGLSRQVYPACSRAGGFRRDIIAPENQGS